MGCEYRPWTTAQNDTMRVYAHKGVLVVQRALLEEHGVYRTEDAINMQASRIHVSLKKLDVCPECGAVGVHLNRQTGLCKRCNLRERVEEEKIYAEMLEAERFECEEGDEVQELEREYAKLRQQNARYKRKHGLTTKKRDACAKVKNVTAAENCLR